MKQLIMRRSNTIEVRSDHLKAMVDYCIEQASTSDIQILDFGDNENALDASEQLAYMDSLSRNIEATLAGINQDLLIVAASEEELEEFSNFWR